MATLKDVARLANCDVSTVSRALNNTSYVHPDTKARILAAVKELNYHPNVITRSLHQGKRRTIGVIVPKIQLSVFGDVILGIQQEARKNGYATLISSCGEDEKLEKDELNRLREGFVDGLIIAGTGKNTRLLRDIHAGGIAMTQIVRFSDHSISSVDVDYELIGYQAAQYMISRGCRQIGTDKRTGLYFSIQGKTAWI
ncbi:MAG: LacI family DNA-binding transcriptional regulator [Firmicutes bacterium]|nr:LacI family DNA-binding transcriptional regulator [Bacillota bacterium]